MPMSNYERLIRLAEKVFDARHDPNQLDVDEKIIERILRLHPASVNQFDDGNGPVAWMLVIPTTLDIMNQFLDSKIGEKQLLDLTPVDAKFEALYLCSALVLEEYRSKGIATRLAVEAITAIQKDHPLKTIFVWPFTKEGEKLAEKISKSVSLPLKIRIHNLIRE